MAPQRRERKLLRRSKQQAASKANDVIEEPTNHTTDTSFPFLKLLSELKNEVYKYTLISAFTLRRIESIRPDRAGRIVATKERNSSRRRIHRNEVRLPHCPATALLYTCRTIYNEALPILYSHNKLHFPMPSRGLLLNKRQQTSFSHLQHVSLDYSHTPSNSWDAYRKNVFWTEDFASHVDATICLAVNQVARGCPVLKTLTLHIFSFPAFVHLVALAAHDQCATTAALSGLVDKLDKLTIVGMAVEYQYGPHQVLCPREKVNDTISRGTPLYNSEYAFLTSIAPWSRWNHGPDPRRGLSWPGLKVNDDFISHDEKARGNEPFKLYEYQEEKYDRRTHQLFRKSEQIWHLMRIVDDEAVDGF